MLFYQLNHHHHFYYFLHYSYPKGPSHAASSSVPGTWCRCAQQRLHTSLQVLRTHRSVKAVTTGSPCAVRGAGLLAGWPPRALCGGNEVNSMVHWWPGQLCCAETDCLWAPRATCLISTIPPCWCQRPPRCSAALPKRALPQSYPGTRSRSGQLGTRPGLRFIFVSCSCKNFPHAADRASFKGLSGIQRSVSGR